MQKRSSKAHLVSVTGRLKHVYTHAELRAYQRSGEFIHALVAMDVEEQLLAQDALARTWVRCVEKTPIPKAGTVRVKKWDAVMIARLRAAEAKFGNDDAIARHLGLPIKAVRPARWKYCGPRRPRTHAQSVGVAATAP